MAMALAHIFTFPCWDSSFESFNGNTLQYIIIIIWLESATKLVYEIYFHDYGGCWLNRIGVLVKLHFAWNSNGT